MLTTQLVEKISLIGIVSVILSSLTFSQKLHGILEPFGLEGKIITSLAGEVQENKFSYLNDLPLVAGTESEGVFAIFPFDTVKRWDSLGLQGKTITALTIQHWGAGPTDGQRVFAAVVPNTEQSDSTLLFEREVGVPLDSVWRTADNGIDRSTLSKINAMSSYYYTGHTPPQPIILGGDTSFYYGRVVWTRANYDARVSIKSIDVHPHWFGDIAWAAGAIVGRELLPVVFRSTDQGVNWSIIPLPIIDFGTASSIAIHTQNPDTVYVGFEDSLYVVTDSGTTWKSHGLPDSSMMITSISLDPLRPENLFVGGLHKDSSLALYVTQNGGENWFEIPMPERGHIHGVSSMAAFNVSDVPDYEATHLFVGTLGSGVWLYRFFSITAVEEVGAIPSKFILFQNYPNPFNPLTVIRYALPVASHVTLKIYNVLGQEVAMLVKRDLQAGVHSVEWKPEGMPSGVYYCRLEAVSSAEPMKSFTQTRKLILLR